MKPHVRRVIAYIAGCVISKRKSSTVYDYVTSSYFSFSINLSKSGVAVYDYANNCHISGSYLSLYHYGEGSHIALQINGNNFTGFDYGGGCHFSGSLNNNSISLYDYGVGSYFNFLI